MTLLHQLIAWRALALPPITPPPADEDLDRESPTHCGR
jgi:hypothetical protein